MPTKRTMWTLEYDPCSVPLNRGMILSGEEIRSGIKFKTFLPGTRIRNEKTNEVKEIKLKDGKLRMV